MKMLIIGASGGLGTAIAEVGHRFGWNVAGTYFSASPGIASNGGCVDQWVQLDLRWSEDLLTEHLSGVHNIDVLVMCAGVSVCDSVLEASEATMSTCLSVNAWGLIGVIRVLSRRKHPLRAIIVVASSAADLTTPTPYALSKRIVIDICASMHTALKGEVGVCAVVPGWIDTGMARRVAEEKGLSLESLRASGELLDPIDVGEVCLGVAALAGEGGDVGHVIAWDRRLSPLPRVCTLEEALRMPAGQDLTCHKYSDFTFPASAASSIDGEDS